MFRYCFGKTRGLQMASTNNGGLKTLATAKTPNGEADPLCCLEAPRTCVLHYVVYSKRQEMRPLLDTSNDFLAIFLGAMRAN